MCPIDLSLVDITTDKVSAFTQEELSHAPGIRFLRRSFVGVLEFVSDDFDEAVGRGYAGFEGAPCADQEDTSTPPRFGILESFLNLINRPVTYRRHQHPP